VTGLVAWPSQGRLEKARRQGMNHTPRGSS
jgi:hypothetical protein